MCQTSSKDLLATLSLQLPPSPVIPFLLCREQGSGEGKKHNIHRSHLPRKDPTANSEEPLQPSLRSQWGLNQCLLINYFSPDPVTTKSQGPPSVHTCHTFAWPCFTSLITKDSGLSHSIHGRILDLASGSASS